MAKKPIKRNKNIVALSRDHHQGLLLCWKIRQGLKLNVELKRIGNYIHFFWKTRMVEHFRKEEELLFSKIDGPVCDRVKDEHGIMRLLVEGIDRHDKNNRNSYIEFSNLLEQHIAIHVRHSNVTHQHIENRLFQRLQCF